MSISIQSNVSSLVAQRHVTKTQSNVNQSLSRLSSGFRINSATDDAAGLGVSEVLKSQIRTLAQASRNASDGLSVIQTAEGAMGEVSSALLRMRELSVQAASDNITDKERGYINTEFSELKSEIDRIAKSTKFNGQVLTDGTFKSGANNLDFQVGHENGADFRITVNVADVSTTGLSLAAADAVDSKANAQAVMAKLDTALDSLNSERAGLGSKANRLTTAASAVDVMRENLSSANSRIRDTNIAMETSSFARSQVLMQAGVSMLAQANSQPQLALSLLR
jgi:flagellin